MPEARTKIVAGRTYVHRSCLHTLSEDLRRKISVAESLAGGEESVPGNVVRLDRDGEHIAFLNYPKFFEDGFPELLESWLVDLAAAKVSYRNFSKSPNPPVLHRKELLLPEHHPQRTQFVELTKAAEAIGLFEDSPRIGFRQQWHRLLTGRGFKVVGNQLVPIGNDESNAIDHSTDTASIARYRTALVRQVLSAPVQTLIRYGFLRNKALFDYGCGHGDDVRYLCGNGIAATGWDPYYAPNSPIVPASVVNLGFVINVIEDFDERVQALQSAFDLAEQLLVVSVMLLNQNALNGRQYNDGVLTKRGTFQKYYTQTELREFLANYLHDEPVAAAPGIFYVFRDKQLEQGFLLERSGRRRRSEISRPSLVIPKPREPKHRQPKYPVRTRPDKYELYRAELDALWSLWLSLGRQPDKSEVAHIEQIANGFGSLGKACRFLLAHHSEALVEAARQRRMEDLQVFLALGQFERRRPYSKLDAQLQKDIKAFFGNYATAEALARRLLFLISSPEAIDEGCRLAAAQGLGWLADSDFLQIHTSLVPQLPALLRVYIACAAALYGDYRLADLVKIHIRSGKLTLMRFDNFGGSPLPRMVERVKIRLRDQDFDYFEYGEEYAPPFLYNKSRYITPEFQHFEAQRLFEKQLSEIGLINTEGYGPSPNELMQSLERKRLQVRDFEIARSEAIPDLDTPCGRHFTYRDFINCGETQLQTGVENRPRQAESYNALYDLATRVIDPVIEYFGMIELTYGFCSHRLAKLIKGRIAPELDQHAAHECNRLGMPICKRLGAAADFLVRDEDMRGVARWIVENLPFDRLYYYGTDRPVHVSFGPESNREAFEMRASPNGRLIPRKFAM